MNLPDVLQILGFIGLTVGGFLLAGAWLAFLVGSVCLLVVGVILERDSQPEPDA